MWVDLYDEAAWADPVAAVADMAAHGVRTLYLETSNADRSSAFVDEAGVSAFLDAGAADGVQVVAWYLPNLQDIATDASRSEAAIAYATAAGNRFAGFALDIESAAVSDATLRTRRLLELSGALRAAAGRHTHSARSYRRLVGCRTTPGTGPRSRGRVSRRPTTSSCR